MKRVLILGAGQSTPYMIQYLLDCAAQSEWQVTVADRDVELAESRVNNHPQGKAIFLDATKTKEVRELVGQSDIVVNLLAPPFQYPIAELCVENDVPMVSASYMDGRVRDLDEVAREKGVLLLCELGLDPGMDHMSSMVIIDEVRSKGGKILKFNSYGSGVSAPDSFTNPMRYVITWNPRNVVMAAEKSAIFLLDGKVRITPYRNLFHQMWPVEVDGVGTMEAYPNRDSVSYKELLGLDDIQTLIRGTLRWPGYGEVFHQIVRLGLPNEWLTVPNMAERTYAEVVEMFLPPSFSEGTIEERVAARLDLSPTGEVMEKLRWLGLFSEEKVGIEGTPADMMAHLLKNKLPLLPGNKDMVVLMHEFEVEYPDGKREEITSTMVDFGNPEGFTAMARTVGLPAAIATKQILDGTLSMSGSRIPIDAEIYNPILNELSKEGIVFKEKTKTL